MESGFRWKLVKKPTFSKRKMDKWKNNDPFYSENFLF